MKYVTVSADGSIVSVVDQGFGIGILKLAVETGQSSQGLENQSNEQSVPEEENEQVDPSEESEEEEFDG